MKKIHLKEKKSRKGNKKKYFNFLFIVFIIYASCMYFFNNFIKMNNSDYTKYLVDKTYNNKSNYTFIVNEGLKLISKIDIKKPETMLDRKILMSKTNKKSKKEEYNLEDNYDTSDYEKITSVISNLKTESLDPILYIYNTHQLETYSNLGVESSGMNPNVMMAAYLLKEKLDKKGVHTLVEDTNMAEFIKASGITNNQFYGSSRIFMQNAIKNNPTLKYFIDLHRDSISKEISTTIINNKNYARILFVIGKSNKNYGFNEELARKISDKINKVYPNLSRGIYERVTSDWPEAYNQDLSKNAMLIELGAKDNTFEEVYNTIEALSNVLSEFIKDN